MPQQSSWKKVFITTIICSMLASGAAYAERSPTGEQDVDGLTSVQQDEQNDAEGLEEDDAVSSTDDDAQDDEEIEGDASFDDEEWAEDDEFDAVIPPASPTGPVKFADVKPGHWAEKHITKLALQGIVRGDGVNFNPASGVTREDAVIMALRFMGLESQVRSISGVVFPTNFVVSDYAKPYIVLAFQRGLLDQSEEFRIADGDAADSSVSKGWGKREASREWITKLAVRAIGQSDMADRLQGRSSSFTDSGKIGREYAGYVNAAVSLGLVNGVTKDTFDPQGSINRASMATIFSRAQPRLDVAYEGQSRGIVAALDDRSITLYEDGAARRYPVSADTRYYRFDSEQAASLSGIERYTEAIVIADESGRALYVEQTDEDMRVETISGTFASVDEDSGLIYLRVGSGFPSVAYDEELLVVEDESGNEYRLDELTEGSSVDVQRDTFRESPMAVRVIIKGMPVNKTGEGKIVSVSPGKVTIRDGEDEREWSVSATAAITKNNLPSSLGELTADDAIRYKVENDIVTEITVDAAAARTVTGKFTAVSGDGKSITYTVNGKLEADFLADDVRVIIEGVPNAKLSDLTADDLMELSMNGAGEVTAIEVVNREVEVANGATILNFDDATKILTVRDMANKPLALALTDKTRFEFNGNEMSLTAADALLTKDRKVSVTYSGTDAVRVEIINKYTGNVINLSSSEITLKLTDGSTIKLPLKTPVVQIYGTASAKLSDLETGRKVTLQLDSSLENVSVVKAYTTEQRMIELVNAKDGKLTLKDKDGETASVTVSQNWSIVDERGDAIKLTRLAAGQTVNVVYEGSDIVELKRVLVTVGKVSAIGADSISVESYDGGTSEVALGDDVLVAKGGSTTASLSRLAAGDRVEVRKNEREQTVVTVLEGQARTFWRYDAAAREVHVKRSGVNDNDYRFKLTDRTIVTDGTYEIALSTFKLDDPITLYIYNGELLEIVKK